MADGYPVELKESVFRETPLTEADFGEDLQIEFDTHDGGQESARTDEHRSPLGTSADG